MQEQIVHSSMAVSVHYCFKHALNGGASKLQHLLALRVGASLIYSRQPYVHEKSYQKVLNMWNCWYVCTPIVVNIFVDQC